MNSATAATLATIFPVIILALVLERERVALNLRRKKWFRDVGGYTIGTALLGTLIALVWTAAEPDASHSWGLGFAIALWVLAAVSLAGFALTLLAIVATSELREDEDLD